MKTIQYESLISPYEYRVTNKDGTLFKNVMHMTIKLGGTGKLTIGDLTFADNCNEYPNELILEGKFKDDIILLHFTKVQEQYQEKNNG